MGVVIIFSAIQSTYRALTGKKNTSDNKRISDLERRVANLERARTKQIEKELEKDEDYQRAKEEVAGKDVGKWRVIDD
ncbi:hypothetical protein R4Y45_06155 [Holzapfeliella sp. He02]|uniref:Uncharacterized protein n=1 Tax=Holzapfeliella saturejae TaxID=3082953 RepID=A0ABU8SIP0_9LACO